MNGATKLLMPGLIGGGRTFEPETNTLLASFSVAPSQQRQRDINTLISTLKNNGLWATLDFLFLNAAHDAQAGKVNWINPAVGLLTAVGGLTFTVNEGFKGNGTDAYLQSALAWTSLTKLVQDSATIGAWISGGTDAAADKYAIGCIGTTSYLLRPRSAAAQINAAVSSSNIALGASATILGHTVATRRSSTDVESYRNGVSVATAATASTGKTGGAIQLLKTSGIYSDFQIKSAHAGSGISDAQATLLYDALNTYQAAILANP